MKKFLSVFLTVALFASLFAFVGCNGHEDLIQGDFSQEATAEQREEVVQILSVGGLWGNTADENWAVNLRQVVYGKISTSVSGAGENADIDMTFNNIDHTVSMRNDGGEFAFWGSGVLNVSTQMNLDGIKTDIAMNGKTYNDMERFYMDVNYSASAYVGGRRAQIKDRMKIYDQLASGGDYGLDFGFEEGDIADSMINVDLLLRALTDTGLNVFIDSASQTETKIKIVWSEESFLEYFNQEIAAELEDSIGVSATEDLLEGVSFGHCEYLLSCNKETGRLTGFGTKVGYSLAGTTLIDSYNIFVKVDSNLTSWMMVTDTPAGDTPQDLGSYTDIDSI